MLSIAAVGLAALSFVAAAPVAQRDSAPAHWAAGYLEDYQTYHIRYLAIDCQDQHNTTFFDDCCHPLLANETVGEHRPAYCTPNATESSSASVYYATATSESADGAGSVYFESTVTADASTTVYATPSATASASADAIGAGAAFAPEVSSSTSEWVAPTTSTSKWVAPTTTSTWVAPATTTAAASSGGDVKTGGFATYFYQGGNPGACGTVHSDSDKIVAIDASGYWSDYASNNNNGNCGKWLTITNTNNGKSVTAMVADVCPTCVSDNSLDLSVGAFTAIASEGDGMVPITWTWA